MVMILLMAGFSGCLDEIKKSPMGGDEIYSDNKELELLIGQKIQLTASPEEFVFEWTSSHPNIATVTNTGLVEAVGIGDADITIRNGNLKLVIQISVGSKMPKQATRFGNGLLVRWDTVNSPALILHQLTYHDRDGVEKIATFDAKIDSAFVEDFASQLQVASIYYYKNDTIRVRPLRYNSTKNAATTIELAGGQMDIRNFDFGREVGWHDETPENTLRDGYREQIGENGCAVDIAPDKYVGDLSAGEWLSYTLDVKSPGTFIIDVNALVTAGDSTVFRFVLDEGTDTLNFTILKTLEETNYKWIKSKATLQPAFYMGIGLHKFKILFTDNNVRIKNIRLTPRSIIGGNNLPTLQYRFEFDNDWTKPSIGNDNLAFCDNSSPPQPIDISDWLVVPKDPPYDGYAITVPRDAPVRIPNPAGATGDTVKKYTMMWDIRIPQRTNLQYHALLHTQENSRISDAQFFINRSNRLGVSDYGPADKPLEPERWYRVVLCIDATSSDSAKYTIYLDGEPYFENPWITRNQRHEQMWLRRHFYIFADDDREDFDIDCASFTFWANRYMSATEVVALGKVKYPEADPLGVTKAIRFGNGVLAFFEDYWRTSYYAQYIAQNGGSWGSYSSTLSPETFYPNCYTGLRVQSVQPSGQLSNPVFFNDSQYTADIAITVSDTGTTIIPAVNFDGGGERVGYYEGNTSREGGNSYRIDVLGEKTSYVDMEGNRNGDPFRDMNISHTGAGEWLQYTVYVRKAGKYYFDIHLVAAGDRASSYLTVNAVDMPPVKYPSQGSWDASNYRWYHEATGTSCQSVLTLKQGLNVIRYNMLGQDHNIKGFRLKPYGLTTPVPLGINKATLFGNGLSLSFTDVGCIDKYTVTYTNKLDVKKTVNITTLSYLIADYKSDIVVKVGTQVIPFDESTILDKTRTLSTGETLDIAAADFDAGRGIGYSTTRFGINEYRASIADNYCGIIVEGSGEAANRNIGGMKIGDWLQYSVDVETEGDYSIDVFIGAGKNDAKYSMMINGVKTASIPVPNNGGHGNYRWNSSIVPCTPAARLKKGVNTIRFNVEGAANNDEPYNLKTIRLSPAVTYVPQGVQSAIKFGNGLLVTLIDNLCVNYTLEYTNTSGTAASKSITSETAMPLFIADHGSGLTAKVTSTGATVPFDESTIIDKSYTLPAGGTLEIPVGDFDGGGNSVGYYTTRTGNNAYRASLGDNNCGLNVADAYNFGSIQNDNWLQYTVNVEAEGDYVIDVSISAGRANGKYSLTVNGEKTPSYAIPNNGSWGAFRWYSTIAACLKVERLKVGLNVIRFNIECQDEDYNVRALKISPALASYEPRGVKAATKFGNGLHVSFLDNTCVNYTLEYISTSGVAASKNATSETATMLIADHGSGLTVKVTATGAIVPFDESTILDKTHTLPAGGTLEIPVADFDGGGKSVGYNTTRVDNNAYRSSLGDENCGLYLVESPIVLGGVRNGDWMRYTVNVEAEGDYVIDVSISAGRDNGKYALTVNGEKTPSYAIPNNGGWGSYRWYSSIVARLKVERLKRGLNTIIFHIECQNEDYNVRALKISPAPTNYEPQGVNAATKFGNGLMVKFIDHAYVNYTLEYTNTSNGVSTRSVTASSPSTLRLNDYKSDLTVKVTETGTVIPFTDIKDVSGTVTAAGLEEMWMVNVDCGGVGIGYDDQGNGAGNRYRDQYLGDVDNYLSVEGGGTNPANLNISHTGGGEWLQYTVFVETAGAYKFDVRLSVNNSNNNAKYRLVVNGGVSKGGEETPEISLQNQSNWSDWRWYHEYNNATQPNPVLNLREGVNTIRFYVINGNYNIKSWRLLP